jgi:hypothetical protein
MKPDKIVADMFQAILLSISFWPNYSSCNHKNLKKIKKDCKEIHLTVTNNRREFLCHIKKNKPCETNANCKK